jgi:dTDP-4-dehydrorhamnose reductase
MHRWCFPIRKVVVVIVVLGASGFIGQAFVRHLTATGQPYIATSRRDIDYYDSDLLAKFLTEINADFLINAAGYSGRPNVDACEEHRAECLHANAVLPGRIRDACERADVPWGHVSSGCIFTGTRPDGSGFLESDEANFSFRTNNCSFYSGSKALGEEVLADGPNCYIWRVRIPFSHIDHPKNYLSKLLRYDRLLEATNSLSNMDEFIAACVDSWILRIPFGVYNLTNGGAVQTSEVTSMLQRTIAPAQDFQFFADESEFMQVAAKTPRSNCVLDNTKALAAGLKLSDAHEAIEQSLHGWIPLRSTGEISRRALAPQ